MFLTRFPGEGFSNSLAEAMAYSLPCIVSDWAANADMIGTGGGIVLKAPQSNDVIEAIKQMGNVVVRREMGYSNFVRAKKEFIQDAVTSQYVEVYDQLV